MTTTVSAAWVLALIEATAPSATYARATPEESADARAARYAVIASDLASVVSAEEPLFSGPLARERTAALMVSIAGYESGFHLDVDEGRRRGDGGRSWCLMQIQIGNGPIHWGSGEMAHWRGKDLVTDRTKCFRAALAALRLSFAACPWLKAEGRIATYTSGRCVADEPRARSRWLGAERLFAANPPPANHVD